MDLRFEVSGRIARPVDEVFEAVVNPDKLSGYFTTGGARGSLETGATVMWDFHDFPGAFPVQVVEVEKNRRIILRWEAGDTAPESPGAAPSPYQTLVTMRFEQLRMAARSCRSRRKAGARRPKASNPASATRVAGCKCCAP